MASLTDVPLELLVYIVKSFDLLDLAALFLSCKEMKSRVESDLTLLKTAADNTPRKLLHSRTKSPLRSVFLEHVATLAIELNSAEYLMFCFSEPTQLRILQKLKPIRENKRDVNHKTAVKRRQIIDEIFIYDADNVLSVLLKHYFNDINRRPSIKSSAICDLMSLLMEFGFPVERETRSARKTRKIVLELFQAHRNIILEDIMQQYKKAVWNISGFPGSELLFSMLQYYMTIADSIQIDFKSNIGNFSPLEYATWLGDVKLFDLFLAAGSVFNKDGAPYLAILLVKHQLGRIDFLKRLLELGADVNARLPPYFLGKHCRNVFEACVFPHGPMELRPIRDDSLVQTASTYVSTQKFDKLTRVKLKSLRRRLSNNYYIRITEMLLSNGALYPDPKNYLDSAFILAARYRPELAIIYSLLRGYSSLQRTVAKLEFTEWVKPRGITYTGENSFTFHKIPQISEQLPTLYFHRLHNKTAIRAKSREEEVYTGSWRQNEHGRIQCSMTKTENSKNQSDPENITINVIVFTAFTHDTAIMIDDPTLPDNLKMVHMAIQNNGSPFEHRFVQFSQ